ncbi:MAG: hypothetical protein JSU98_14165 [Gemmatimonadales bacterium]|nr:MAG: hypothetical protein JSU98_14165 [Gemmatimonadales bacterium]
MRIFRLLHGFLLLSAMACGDRPAPPGLPSATVRDSAGVQVVENRWVDVPVPGWAIGSDPIFAVGDLTGDRAYEFTSVTGAARLTSGRVAVMDGPVSELRIYGPDGSHEVTLGRKGSGPEEFGSPVLAGRLPGDTLVVFDRDRRWVALVHPEGGFGRSFLLGPEAGDFVQAQGLVGDQAMAFGGGMFFSSDEGFPQGRVRPRSTYGTVGLDGSPGMSLGDIPAAEMWAAAVEGGFRAWRLPFGKITVAAAGPRYFYLGLNESWEIAVYGLNGELSSLIRTDRPTPEVTAALRDAYLDEQESRADDEAERVEIRATFRDIPFAQLLPHYELLRVDALGYLWVRDPSLPGETSSSFSVFDSEGLYVGRMSLPEHVHPLEIGTDYIVGRVTDEFDVETVRIYPLSRGP